MGNRTMVADPARSAQIPSAGCRIVLAARHNMPVTAQPEVTLDGVVARRWAQYAAEGLERAKDTLDSLNVFPVPDGDTGTNLVLTMRRAAREVALLPADAPVADVLSALARGALRGARGNSGIITSQLLLGWAQAWARARSASPVMLARALTRADEQAWTAVATPLEGTILSVTRAAARAAEREAVAGADVAGVVRAAAWAAREALVHTTAQLRELREAGVVDAGGAGVVVLLDALEAAVTGEPARDSLRDIELGHAPDREEPGAGPAFEVMYLLTGEDLAADELRRELGRIGDSVVVVGGSGLWHVHVHTDDAGAAIEAGTAVGNPHRIRVVHLATGERRPAPRAEWPAGAVGTLAVVACATGPGLARAYQQAGLIPVQPEGSSRASTEELLDAILASGAQQAVVLPNDPDTIPVAAAVARAAAESGVEVVVVPTRSQMHGLAAAAVYDPHLPAAACAQHLLEAVAGVQDGAVAIAARDAATPAGHCRPGQALGLIGGEVARIGTDPVQMATDLVVQLSGSRAELLTVVVGEQAPDGLLDAVVAQAHAQGLEVEVIDGGQPVYPVLLGVE